jgi:hypothetical protein
LKEARFFCFGCCQNPIQPIEAGQFFYEKTLALGGVLFFVGSLCALVLQHDQDFV